VGLRQRPGGNAVRLMGRAVEYNPSRSDLRANRGRSYLDLDHDTPGVMGQFYW
jgi:hypothetical protein